MFKSKIIFMSLANKIKIKDLKMIEKSNNIFKKQLFFLDFSFDLKKENKKCNFKNITSIEYINNKNKVTKLFGNKFIRNNKKKCNVVINNKQMKLFEEIKVNKETTKIKIKLIGFSFLNDISMMFYKCINLKSILFFSDYNTKKIKDISGMFLECTSLSSLPDISNWNIKKLNNLSSLFYNCSSINNLPDISKWDTSNIKFIARYFKMEYKKY